MAVAPAVAFVDLVLAVHILAAIAGFGVAFAYPLFIFMGSRLQPAAMPWFHRMQQLIGRRLINPALLIVLVAGIYLASKEDQWHAFYVQWGLGAVIVIGALEGAFMIPREGRLAELARRDLAQSRAEVSQGAGAGVSAGLADGPGAEATATARRFTWSTEYDALLRRVELGGGLLLAIVVVTVFLMATHAGA